MLSVGHDFGTESQLLSIKLHIWAKACFLHLFSFFLSSSSSELSELRVYFLSFRESYCGIVKLGIVSNN